MLHILVLLAACAGDATEPTNMVEYKRLSPPAGPAEPIAVRVLPGTVTIEINQRVRFRRDGAKAPALRQNMHWEANGGTIDSLGVFSARQPGTYRIVGRLKYAGHLRATAADTGTVIVIPRSKGVVRVKVTPGSAELAPGAERAFTAAGKLKGGDTTPIGVKWNATGGTIDPAGVYRAGSAAGRYRVIATNLQGTLADTVRVTIADGETPDTAVTPAPEPPDTTATPDPEPSVTRIILRPASVALAPRATYQFSGFGRDNAGDSVAVDVVFTATGGTINQSGLYTAGSTVGSYKVIASAKGLADTALITLAAVSGGETPPPAPAPVAPGRGLPYGPTGNLLGSVSDPAPFTAAVQGVSPDNIVRYLAKAREAKIRLELNMTGGQHERNFAPGGDRFDMATWKARMNGYNTPAIKAAVAEAVADGTIIGNSVMDEPHVSGGGDGNTWGPKGTMTKAMVDEMCGYVKAIFPTLPVGVAHRHDAFEPNNSYRVCEFVITQYAARLGSITAFRDGALALGRRDGHAILFSINILNGGTQDRDGTWDCPQSGKGTYSPNCRMTPDQVRQNGLALGPAGCGLLMWRYDAEFMAKPENRRAFQEIANTLAALPNKACRRS
jgi:hypothetical protein